MTTTSSHIIMIVIAVLSLIQLSQQCYCSQCTHVAKRQKRCECCVYMLHGKRSGNPQQSYHNEVHHSFGPSFKRSDNIVEQRHLLSYLLQKDYDTIPDIHNDEDYIAEDIENHITQYRAQLFNKANQY